MAVRTCLVCLAGPCVCSFDESIVVAEDYCVACQGKCTNTDPSDYMHMMADWESLSGGWLDRGATASDIWSFIASVLLTVAKNNGVTWDEVHEVLRLAWKKGEESNGDH